MLPFQDIDIDAKALDYYLNNLVRIIATMICESLFHGDINITLIGVYTTIANYKVLINGKTNRYLQPIGKNIDPEYNQYMIEDAVRDQPLRLYSRLKNLPIYISKTSVGNISYIYQNRDFEDYFTQQNHYVL